MFRQTITASHLSLSFKKCFSQQGFGHHKENIKQDQSSVSVYAFDSKCNFDGSPSKEETSAVFAKSHSKLSPRPSVGEDCYSCKASSSSTPSSALPETLMKCTNSTKDEDQSSIEMTPVTRTLKDLASTPAKLMSATPMLCPPRRCYMSPDDDNLCYMSPDDDNLSRLPGKQARCPPYSRPLQFDTPVKSLKVGDKFGRSENSSTDDDIFDILPEDLLQLIQEKEKLASMEQNPSMSQAKWRRQMIASLPKIFNLICLFFHPIRRSVVTKEELIQKTITGHLDIINRSEAEEQLRLLLELALEWIFEKATSSEDIHLWISCLETICTRLSEVK